MRDCRSVHRGMRYDGTDRVRRREHRQGHDRVPGLGLRDSILPVLGVAEVIRGRDHEDQRQRERREPELSSNPPILPRSRLYAIRPGKALSSSASTART